MIKRSFETEIGFSLHVVSTCGNGIEVGVEDALRYLGLQNPLSYSFPEFEKAFILLVDAGIRLLEPVLETAGHHTCLFGIYREFHPF